MARISCTTRVAVLAAAALLAVAACSPRPHGPASAPRGMLYAAGSYIETDHGWLPPRDTRVYRDGRLMGIVRARVLEARDHADRSLLYDELAGRARPIRGGPWRPFDPCPVSYHLSGRTLALSPDGRRGLCVGRGDDYDWLFLFDPAHPNGGRRRIFEASDGFPKVAAWIDDRRIAVQEFRRSCGRVFKRMPTGLAVIDLDGRVIERGPCTHGLVAGTHGPILVKLVIDWRGWVRVLRAMTGEPVSRTVFSGDGGHSWAVGMPQFADADGRVFYLDEEDPQSTLRVDGMATPVRNISYAVWARP